MALIDVSELLQDPDFTDDVQLIRRTRTVNQYGENVLTDVSKGTVRMVVQPSKPSALQRLPEGAVLKNSITVWYKGILNLEAVNGYGDVVVWRGDRYNLITSADFTNYGEGYTSVLALQERPNE